LKNQKAPRLLFPAAAVLAVMPVVSRRAATFSTNSTSDAFVSTGPSDNGSGNNYGGAGVLELAARLGRGIRRRL